MLEFQAPPLINNLIGGNSITDTRTHASVEYFAIIRASLREAYKKGEEEQYWGEIHKRKVRTQSWKYRSPARTSSRELGYLGAFSARLNLKQFNTETQPEVKNKLGA